MGFVKNMQEHDLSLLQALDGEYILYTSTLGNIRVIDGMLQTRTAFVPGTHVEMVTTETVLQLRAIDADEMQIGERIAVDSNTYEIASIRPDNEGISEIVLEKL